MPLSIRPAAPEDGDWLFELHEAAMRDRSEELHGPWQRDRQRERFSARTEPDVRVVWRDDVRVGAVRLRNDGDGILWIGLIEILPEHQGQGLGTTVLQALDEEAARAGDAVELRVRHGNRARRLYERVGFRAIASDDTHVFMRRG